LNHLTPADLYGIARLALHGAGELTDLVEDLHQTIAAPFDVLHQSRGDRTGGGRTSGITGLVYRSIQAGFTAAGRGLDLTGNLAVLFSSPDGGGQTTPKREALLAGVNGAHGDFLAATQNPLAIKMSLRSGGRSLLLEQDALAAEFPAAGSRVVVLVHGLCMNDLQWQRKGHDHGAALARDLGYTPLYLHYNSGAHISTNGRACADLLERLVDQWPRPLDELVIVGHSMGGLVTRSAVHYGLRAGHVWPTRLRRIIFLGTPHHGSPWEQIGAWVGKLPSLSRYTAPFGRLARMRSAGITDLRYGSLLDEDWAGGDRFACGPDLRTHVPLPSDVHCCVVAGTLGAAETLSGVSQGRLLGDGLVSVDSALGIHPDPSRSLPLGEDCRWVGYDTGHLDLLGSPEVYAQIKTWLAGA
jgi:pimeloyl-ACP methyl ester carboxylesterase